MNLLFISVLRKCFCSLAASPAGVGREQSARQGKIGPRRKCKEILERIKRYAHCEKWNKRLRGKNTPSWIDAREDFFLYSLSEARYEFFFSVSHACADKVSIYLSTYLPHHIPPCLTASHCSKLSWYRIWVHSIAPKPLRYLRMARLPFDESGGLLRNFSLVY